MQFLLKLVCLLFQTRKMTEIEKADPCKKGAFEHIRIAYQISLSLRCPLTELLRTNRIYQNQNQNFCWWYVHWHLFTRTCGMETQFLFMVVWSCWTRICPVFEKNSVDPDQLASSEANWSGSTLFAIQYVNLYQQPGSRNPIGWKS